MSVSKSARTPRWHRIAEGLIGILATSAIAAIALIFVFVSKEALPLFWESEVAGELRLRDLFLPRQWPGYDEPVYVWQPVGAIPKFNVVPLFVGSLKVTVIAMGLSVPLGVGCALFTNTYASKRLREIVKPVVELLAGIPSVVLGFFALVVIASWLQDVGGFTYRLNGVVAGVGLAMTIVPLIFTVADDALQTVPRAQREAALALGARRYQVALRVVAPAAMPGIAAGIVLGFGRAVGETMIVLMASGNAAVVDPFDLTSSVRTVTATVAAELGEVSAGDPHWRVLFLLGAILFALTFVLNALGRATVVHLSRRFRAEDAR